MAKRKISDGAYIPKERNSLRWLKDKVGEGNWIVERVVFVKFSCVKPPNADVQCLVATEVGAVFEAWWSGTHFLLEGAGGQSIVTSGVFAWADLPRFPGELQEKNAKLDL